MALSSGVSALSVVDACLKLDDATPSMSKEEVAHSMGQVAGREVKKEEKRSLIVLTAMTAHHERYRKAKRGNLLQRFSS
jgi:hypothetical protein